MTPCGRDVKGKEDVLGQPGLADATDLISDLYTLGASPLVDRRQLTITTWRCVDSTTAAVPTNAKIGPSNNKIGVFVIRLPDSRPRQ